MGIIDISKFILIEVFKDRADKIFAEIKLGLKVMDI